MCLNCSNLCYVLEVRCNCSDIWSKNVAHVLQQLIQCLNIDKPIVILMRNGLSLCVSLFSLSFALSPRTRAQLLD